MIDAVFPAFAETCLMRTLFGAALALLATTALATAPAAAAAPDATMAQADIGPAPEGRLPAVARPIAYRVDLTVLPEKERFGGHVEIDVELAAPAPALWINGRDLAVSKVVAKGASGVVAARYRQIDALGVARLDFAKPLPAGRTTLVFDYDAPFSTAAASLFRVQVDGKWYVWSQFESIDGRGAFPSFDEPGWKTPYTVTLTTHPGFVTTSNTAETGVVKAGALERHVFATTLPLPTYLVQFGVGPFAVVKGEVPPTPERAKPLPLRVVATQPNAGRMDYALKETPRIIELLEKYFGQPFPFPKLDQIASPIMPGAMENAGADTYNDTLILLDDGASTRQRQAFGMVVSHELAHQWFGDLVTPAWWDDLWLNESFAQWMGYRIGNEWRPELNIGIGILEEGFAAMTTDSLVAGRPIHQPIAKNGEIDSAFDSVTYGKGGHVITMIAAYLGDEKFQAGVRLHLQRHAYGNATSEDFFTSLADAAKDPRVVGAMKSFVDQQGVPIVTIGRGPGGTLIATQKRFALLGSQVTPESWTIPLCVRVGTTKNCSLLDQPSAPLALKGSGAIMPNVGGNGYYRFALADADWKTLIAASATLPAGEALATTDSLWAGFRAGDIAPVRLVEAARAMASNPDSNAAVDGGERLAGLRVRGMVPDAALPAYRRTMDAIYAPKLAAIGDDLRAGAYASDSPDKQKLRAALIDLVGIEARDATLRTKLIAGARAYLAGDIKALDQSVMANAFTAYIQEGGVAAAREVSAKMVSSPDELFRGAARDALGTTNDAAIGRWVIASFQGSTLRPTDKSDLLTELMAQPATRDMAYAYLIANFEPLAKDAGVFNFGRLMTMPSRFCSTAKADEIAATLGPRETQYKRGALELARTVEVVKSCGLLEQKRGTELVAALGT